MPRARRQLNRARRAGQVGNEGDWHAREAPPPSNIYTGPGGQYVEQPGDVQPPAAGGAAGGDGGGGTPAPEHSVLPGFDTLPPDVQARVDAIMRDGQPNPADRAMAYVRTTPWYATEYAGIGAGVAANLFDAASPEAGYRGWKNSVKRTFLQHYGRAPTQAEIETFLASGWDPQRIEQVGVGFSTVQAQRADLQYSAGAFGSGQFTEEEMKAYGEQQAGIDTELGQKIQAKVAASLQRMQSIFTGQLGSNPALTQSIGLTTQTRRQRPDIQS